MLRWIDFKETLPADRQIDVATRDCLLLNQTVCHNGGNLP
jgi:hypothetical protein